MRTTHPAWSWKRRRPRSRSATAARPLLPDSCIATGPGRGIKMTLPFTNWPSRDSATGGGRGHGAARASSPPSPTLSGDTGAGPPRRTSDQTMVFPATQRCGAGSGASRQRSSWRGGNALEVLISPDSFGRAHGSAVRSEISRRFLGDAWRSPSAPRVAMDRRRNRRRSSRGAQ